MAEGEGGKEEARESRRIIGRDQREEEKKEEGYEGGKEKVT